VVFFVFFLLVLSLLRQRGIFCIFSIGFVTVATAWYFLYFFSIGFVSVATAWYFLYFLYFYSIGFGTVATSVVFLFYFYWFWDCCDSVVF
jgi:hypothetical protein